MPMTIFAEKLPHMSDKVLNSELDLLFRIISKMISTLQILAQHLKLPSLFSEKKSIFDSEV